MPDPTTDRITELLAAHDGYSQINPDWHACKCAVWITGYDGAPEPEDAHRAHVAALLAVLVADAQTDAWEQGHGTGFSDCSRYLAAVESNRFPRPTDTPNPYREVSE